MIRLPDASRIHGKSVYFGTNLYRVKRSSMPTQKKGAYGPDLTMFPHDTVPFVGSYIHR